MLCIEVLENCKCWILVGFVVLGDIVIDDGVVNVVVGKGSSLFVKGVFEVWGKFVCGEVVCVIDCCGMLIVKGIVVYLSKDLVKIIGKYSKDIGLILGYDYGFEVIYCDDLVVI